MLHRFTSDISSIPVPEVFNNPFDYVPHELCKVAAAELQSYLGNHPELCREGKMFGVLVVRCADGSLGWLAGFSGNINHRNRYPFFVPPVFDLLDADGFFVKDEAELDAVNARIAAIERSEELAVARRNLAVARCHADSCLDDLKRRFAADKVRRDALRAQGVDADTERRLIAESQFQKAELKRVRQRLAAEEAVVQARVDEFDNEALRLKAYRKERSAEVQRHIFSSFVMLNARGERRSLLEIFSHTPQGIPPAGAGECAAPKMLQYAYLNGMLPLVMAEFWWGDSPASEVRHHAHFYPACVAKCKPILGFMLQGLDVEPERRCSDNHDIKILYDDPWLLVVDKPAGMLSVPGRIDATSVWHKVQHSGSSISPMAVHRLDMDTSGVLVFAKDINTYRVLQRMFARREVRKTYIAVLDGIVTADSGTIELPLHADPLHRPRQCVDFERGKPAVTDFRVIIRSDDTTTVEFSPHTGRTHQLRVHAAHRLGLNTPIVGDRLYGRRQSQRLYLHALRIELQHPVTGDLLSVESPLPWRSE